MRFYDLDMKSNFSVGTSSIKELAEFAKKLGYAGIAICDNFQGFEKTQVLDTEADKLVSVIRQAQIWALTGQTSDNVRYSYGIHLEECNALETCEYIFFKDIDKDYIYDQNESITSGNYAFIKGVYIDSVDPNLSGILDIAFVPPLTEIYFNGETSTSQAEIILTSSFTSGNQKIITINQESGQIMIE